MIPKSGNRFSERSCSKKLEPDSDSAKNDMALDVEANLPHSAVLEIERGSDDFATDYA